MARRPSQVKHLTLFSGPPIYQARGRQQSDEWFLKGLERFANVDDSMEDYRAFAKAWPTFWPLPLLVKRDGSDLAWDAEAHALFIYFRDTLRKFWTRDPAVLNTRHRVYILFGALSYPELEAIIFDDKISVGSKWRDAIEPLKAAYPGMRVTGGYYSAMFWPEWSTGKVLYISHYDFQRALWCLFSSSWRAKVCPHCATYFVAQKAAQLYCSVGCSNATHQANSLRWWREKGSAQRSERMKKKARKRN